MYIDASHNHMITQSCVYMYKSFYTVIVTANEPSTTSTWTFLRIFAVQCIKIVHTYVHKNLHHQNAHIN